MSANSRSSIAFSIAVGHASGEGGLGPGVQLVCHGASSYSTRFLTESRLGVAGGNGGTGGAGVTGIIPAASSPGCRWTLNIVTSWLR